MMSKFIFVFFFVKQARRRWSTRQDNGMKNVSVVVYVNQLLVLNRLYQGSKRFIVLNAMRRNMQHVVLSVIW